MKNFTRLALAGLIAATLAMPAMAEDTAMVPATPVVEQKIEIKEEVKTETAPVVTEPTPLVVTGEIKKEELPKDVHHDALKK